MDLSQYLQFALGKQEYAIPLCYIREIIKPLEIRNLLGAPDYVKGITKVRDEVLTIIDLHRKFGVDAKERTGGEPRIIILDHGNACLGLYVDDVIEIIETNSLEAVPAIVYFGTISQIIKLEDNILPILDIERLLSKDVTAWLNSEEKSEPLIE
ncbi:chemotaxis protein CheW [Dehalobacter sp. DCM]|uniref:chemotaxis protein CheW n=1 Tax=Dehalobacter sp. DCM TaxID=2907827 RepID=UPI003081E2A5|nr:chemotaxis protein CheW [Dehalobacter sp. DCM]